MKNHIEPTPEEVKAVYGELHYHRCLELIDKLTPEQKQEAALEAAMRHAKSGNSPPAPSDHGKQEDDLVLPEPEMSDETRREVFADNGYTRCDKLLDILYPHAEQVKRGNKDHVIRNRGTKKEPVYVARIGSLCRGKKSCPRYALYFFAWMANYGDTIIRRIWMEDMGERGESPVIELHPSFVMLSPAYYKGELRRVEAELRRVKVPWHESDKPTSYPAVMEILKKHLPPGRANKISSVLEESRNERIFGKQAAKRCAEPTPNWAGRVLSSKSV